MKLLIRPLQLLYFLYAALLFLALMVPVFLFAICASFAGVIRGGNLIWSACRLWADIWFPLAGIHHRNRYEQPLRKGTAYIFVANHISYLDAALMPKVFRQPVRPLGKVEITRAPVFGYIYKRIVVTVDRTDAEHRRRSIRRLKSVLRKGISILVFPEGTFNETHRPLAPFFDGAFRIAIETGTPVKPVILPDVYSRMPYDTALSLNPGRCRAIFLEEVPVAGLTADDIPRLREAVYAAMEQKLREYGASWIGDD